MLQPFGNGSELMAWQSRNCDICPLYENESTRAEEAKCVAAFFVDMSSITGSVPFKECKEIGGTYNQANGTVKFNDQCRKRINLKSDDI